MREKNRTENKLSRTSVAEKNTAVACWLKAPNCQRDASGKLVDLISALVRGSHV